MSLPVIRYRALLCLFMGSMGACRGSARQPAPAPKPGPRPAIRLSAAPPKDAGATMRPIAPGHREPVVGGCSDRCLSSKAAARNLLLALLDPTADLPPARRLLDSRELVYDGEALGARWHEQWLHGEGKARNASIARFVATLQRRLKPTSLGVAPRTLVDTSLEQAPSGPGAAVYLFHTPGAARPWKLKFHLRGVEWLLVIMEMGDDL